MEPEVSIIVTTRNEPHDVLLATLEGLNSSSGGVQTEVIVVDDGSEPPIPPIGPHVRQIRNAVAVGVSQARRYGADIGRAPVLCWLDAHMSFADGWLDEMLGQADTGALLCSSYSDYDRRQWRCWGADFTWNCVRDYSGTGVPGVGFALSMRPPDRSAVDVPVIIGGCYMMARNAYEHCGGFSPFFRVWGVDEQDISVRAWLTGCGARCVATAEVGHLWRPAFPYPIHFEDIEYNQMVLLRTAFEPTTVTRLSTCFDPVPEVVSRWLEETDLASWRELIQDNRRLSDEDFFRRFLPSLSVSH
jgi:glycosyltransferase involved in cell wall biosynthesis